MAKLVLYGVSAQNSIICLKVCGLRTEVDALLIQYINAVSAKQIQYLKACNLRTDIYRVDSACFGYAINCSVYHILEDVLIFIVVQLK